MVRQEGSVFVKREDLEERVIALGSGEGHGRTMAAEQLAGCEDERAIWALLPLLRDRFFLARRAAARALTRLGWQPKDELAQARLHVALGDWAAVRLLGASAAVVALSDHLAEEHAETARSVFETLATFGDNAVPIIHRGLAQGNAEVRRRCLDIVPLVDDGSLYSPVVAALEAREIGIRLVAIRALLASPSEAVADALVARLQVESSRAVLDELYAAMAEHAEQVLPRLVALLDETDDEQIIERCFRVCEATGGRAIDIVRELAADVDRPYAARACRALSHISQPSPGVE